MVTASQLSDVEVRRLADEVFSRSFDQPDRPDLNVVSGESFDGDSALFVTAVYSSRANVPDGAEQTRLQSDLARMLIAHGDFRVAYVRLLPRDEFNELREPLNPYDPDA